MEIKEIIAKNIADLRKYKKWTQMELAEKLHYTDKAVSKWERAESTPDVENLYAISKLFGVSVDYLFHEHKNGKNEFIFANAMNWFKKMMWLFIFAASCELAALIVFIIGQQYEWPNMWICFVWTAPVINVATFVFFQKIKNWLGSVISAALVPWTILVGLFFQLWCFPPYRNLWLIFLLGIPVCAAIILFAFIQLDKSKKKLL